LVGPKANQSLHPTAAASLFSGHSVSPAAAAGELVRSATNINMSKYSKRLQATKAHYPFARWAASGLEQYTDHACASFVRVFDNLIAKLISVGEMASEQEKLDAFHEAVDALNKLNDEDLSLIETGEREDLCDLCNVVASAAGLDPSKYGAGEGPASEWRDW
jgi:hypothetical protein